MRAKLKMYRSQKILIVTMQKMHNVDNAHLMFFPLGPIYLHDGGETKHIQVHQYDMMI